MTATTLRGPNGLTLVLDPTEVIPSDPGAGTPAMVYVGREAGTYWAAAETGELTCGPTCYQLNEAQMRWLQQQECRVSDWLQDVYESK